jgi:hypothetical protein
MLSSNVLRNLRGLLTTSSRRARKWVEGGPRRQPSRQARPGLELLERREVPATYSPVVVGSGGLFGLSATGQVFESTNSGTSWFAITGSNTKATALVSAEGGHVFMLASNGALNQTVYEYSGSGTDWGQGVTGPNTYATALVSTGFNSDLYMLGTNGPSNQTVYVYNNDYYGSQNWTAVTGDNTNATALVQNWGSLYMLAGNGPAYQTVYVYNADFFGSQNWTAVTGDNTHATTLATSGGNLYMLGSNGPDYQHKTVYQYGGSPFNWSALTGDNTQVFEVVADSDGNLDMVATNGGTPSVWRYGGSGTNWTPLTGAGLQNALAAWQLALAHPLAAPGETYSPANGTLFGAGGPSYLDVRQGAAGDCWLMASLAETADRVPADIQGMFIFDGTTVENGSTVGVYSVRFYNSNGEAQYFTVDTELPGAGGIYDHPVNGVLWAALAEKAYAEASAVGFVTSGWDYSNTYASLSLSGGWPEYALPAITGNSATAHYAINPSDVASAWNAGELVVLCTPQTAGPNASPYIVSNHCYALVNYDPSSGLPYEVYNPWGTASNGWVNGVVNGTYGLFNADADFLSANFSSQAFGVGAAQDGHRDRHARSSQELADLVFLADLLDPHAKTRAIAGASPISAVSVN